MVIHIPMRVSRTRDIDAMEGIIPRHTMPYRASTGHVIRLLTYPLSLSHPNPRGRGVSGTGRGGHITHAKRLNLGYQLIWGVGYQLIFTTAQILCYNLVHI